MPSPILHAASGASLCLLDRRAVSKLGWPFVALVMLAAVLPDIDFLPGLLTDQPNRYHQVFLHSFAFAAVAALAAGLVWGIGASRAGRRRVMFWVFAAWVTHAALDTLSVDGRPPYGVPLWWPFSSQTVYSTQPIFAGLRHGDQTATAAQFVSDVFSSANLRAIAIEALVASLMLLVSAGLGRLVMLVRPRSNPNPTMEPQGD